MIDILEPEPPRRLPRWAKALILTVSLVGIGLGAMAWVRSAAKREWKEMVDRTRVLIEEANARSGAREVQVGPATPGNAWDDYKLALDELQPVRQRLTLIANYLNRDPRTDIAAAEKFIADHAAAFDHLRRGARRAEGAYPYDWSGDDINPFERAAHQLGISLANLAVAQTRILQASGKTIEAADLLLDLLQFGSDLRRNAPMIGEMYGSSVSHSALNELGEILQARKLKAEELSEISRRLDVVDRNWAEFTVTIRNENLYLRKVMQREDLNFLGGGTFNAFKAWRYGFSVRRMIASFVAENDRFTERAVRGESMAWADRIRDQRQMGAESLQSKNPLVAVLRPGAVPYGIQERSARARLRILRSAIAFLTTDRPDELRDPFATTLRHSRTETHVRIWSVGVDGIDQNGQGKWKTNDNPGDIVFEFPK